MVHTYIHKTTGVKTAGGFLTNLLLLYRKRTVDDEL